MPEDGESNSSASIDGAAVIERLASEHGLSEQELTDRLTAVISPETSPEDWMQEVETTFEEMIEDVRDRVIQVKRETDEKASAEHEHTDLTEHIDSVGEAVESLESDVRDFETRVDAGFDNYEEVVDQLVDLADNLEEKQDILASTVVDIRDTVTELSRTQANGLVVDRIAEDANSLGVKRAICESCRGAVDIALLVEPKCPHCSTQFTDIEPKRWFFGSSVLMTGTPPALESDTPEQTDQTQGEQQNESTDEADYAGAPVTEFGTTHSIVSIQGITADTANQLRDAGVDTIGDLATVDPDVLRDQLDVTQEQVERWIDAASEMTSDQ